MCYRQLQVVRGIFPGAYQERICCNLPVNVSCIYCLHFVFSYAWYSSIQFRAYQWHSMFFINLPRRFGLLRSITLFYFRGCCEPPERFLGCIARAPSWLSRLPSPYVLLWYALTSISLLLRYLSWYALTWFYCWLSSLGLKCAGCKQMPAASCPYWSSGKKMRNSPVTRGRSPPTRPCDQSFFNGPSSIRPSGAS